MCMRTRRRVRAAAAVRGGGKKKTVHRIVHICIGRGVHIYTYCCRQTRLFNIFNGGGVGRGDDSDHIDSMSYVGEGVGRGLNEWKKKSHQLPPFTDNPSTPSSHHHPLLRNANGLMPDECVCRTATGAPFFGTAAAQRVQQ